MNESRADILINRIASIDETSSEFAEFESIAATSEWERLARTLRDELQMRSALDRAMACDARADIAGAIEREGRAARATRMRTTGWSGWAVAAALALALTLAIVLPRSTDPSIMPVSSAQFVSLTADEALDQYLRAAEKEGRIVAELPAVLVESYEAEDGRLEVFYVRQLLERDRIAHVYNLAEDEHGSFVPVRVDPASLFSMPSSM